MNLRRNDISGQRFGMLTVLSPDIKSKNGTWKWRCRCDCGAESVVFGTSLRSGATTSCGCKRGKNITHGMTNTPTFLTWRSMKNRCDNPSSLDYPAYGGRGITYDPRWANFEVFLADMGVRPVGKTLDRKDNDQGYSLSNCKWSTPKEQANNRRTKKAGRATITEDAQ